MIELHISNTHARETFRRRSYLSPVARAVIQGFGVDGYALARRIRREEVARKATSVPIIAISAASGDAHKMRCLESGMDGVVGKPLRLDALRQMIDLWCPAYSEGVSVEQADR